MKNKRWIYLGICVVVIFAFYYLGNHRWWGHVVKRDFAFADTGKLTRIFMANKQGKQVLLEKKEDRWLIDGEEVYKPWVSQLMETIARVEVKSPVPKGAFDDVVRAMAVSNVKVELWAGDELVKRYFVGGPTGTHDGTYMLMDGSDEPFITEIRGFDGYLTPRYNVNAQVWRSRQLVLVNAASIKQIRVQRPKQPEASFTLTISGDRWLLNGQPLKASGKAQYYRELVSKLSFEGYLEQADTASIRRDLNREVPYFQLDVTDASGKVQQVKIFQKPVDQRTKQQFTPEGVPLQTDPERYYILVSRMNQVLLGQDYVLHPLFLTLTDWQ